LLVVLQVMREEHKLSNYPLASGSTLHLVASPPADGVTQQAETPIESQVDALAAAAPVAVAAVPGAINVVINASGAGAPASLSQVSARVRVDSHPWQSHMRLCSS
jgi:hypothetical protein